MKWNNGYVTDVSYEASFFPEQSPVHLNFACLLNGFEPVPIEEGFNYCELGFGQGFTVNALAAANPRGQFYATDFNPAHVVAARQLSASAQLKNLILLENSFAELAEGKVDLPQFDFITMYGVYSWVNAENRRHIVDFMVRYLKPGGIVYVNYNAMPGWAPALPLQRLMHAHGKYPVGRSGQLAQARQLIDGLIEAEARYFTSNTTSALQYHLDHLKQAGPAYLAHEYMNDDWGALYHSDVAHEFARAKLDYACPATPFDAFPYLSLTAAQRKLIAAIPDVALRETAVDYIKNTGFRQDIFVRGARRMSPRRQREWLQQAGLALTAVREDPANTKKFPESKTVEERAYTIVLDELAQGPKTLAELADLLDPEGIAVAGMLEIAAVLTTMRQTCPYWVSFLKNDTAPAFRMNRAIAQQARFNDACQALVSPLLGSALKCHSIHRLVYRALCRQPDEIRLEALIEEVWQITAEGRKEGITKGIDAEPAGMDRTEVATMVEKILMYRVPIWAQLKML